MLEVTNIVVPIQLIKPHPENYNQHAEQQIQQLEASYEALGQFRSVVLWRQSDDSYIQLAGHGVVEAMKREGATHVRADVLPLSLDAMDAKRIMLADNLHARNSEPDEELLAHLLQEQQDAGFDLASLGTDDEALRQMLESLGDNYLGDGEEEDEPEKETSGNLLALLDVTIAEPRHVVASGDIWKMGKHTLIVAHVFKDWGIWTTYLKDDTCLFLPFPGPMVALSDKAEAYTLVLVQPDTYISGHILDRYTDIHGEKAVKKVEHVIASQEEEEFKDEREEDEEKE